MEYVWLRNKDEAEPISTQWNSIRDSQTSENDELLMGYFGDYGRVLSGQGRELSFMPSISGGIWGRPTFALEFGRGLRIKDLDNYLFVWPGSLCSSRRSQ